LTYIFCHFSCNCFQWTCPTKTAYIPCAKLHAHFPLLTSFQGISPSSRPRIISRKKLLLVSSLWYGVVSPKPYTQTGLLPHVGSPRLLSQYIRSYSSYLEAVSFIRSVSTFHAAVTRNRLIMSLHRGHIKFLKHLQKVLE
jgi:hypothetical protein